LRARRELEAIKSAERKPKPAILTKHFDVMTDRGVLRECRRSEHSVTHARHHGRRQVICLARPARREDFFDLATDQPAPQVQIVNRQLEQRAAACRAPTAPIRKIAIDPVTAAPNSVHKLNRS
jgi:cytochrome oxidase assembly protein ShyY1